MSTSPTISLKAIMEFEHLKFGVATATVTLPAADSTEIAADEVAKLKKQLRKLKYNPERFIESSLCESGEVKTLIERKRTLVGTAGDRGRAAEEKDRAWAAIAEVNKKLLAFAEPSVRNLLERMTTAENEEQSRRVRNYREYFFGLFSEADLRKMLQA